MTRLRCASAAIAAFLLISFVSTAAAGPGYEVKLKNGAVYKITLTDSGAYNVSNSGGTLVGTAKFNGKGFDVFDAKGKSLGTAARLNPGVVELIDAHLSGGV